MVQIAVAGSGDPELIPEAEGKARAFARALPLDVILLTGGKGGIMEVVSEEFRKRGGTVVGVLPGDEEGNPYSSVRVKTGLSPVGRSVVLVTSADVLVVLGGGSGTMVEALMAYNLGIPVVVLTGTGYRSDELRALAKDGFFDHRKRAEVAFTESPEEAVELALGLARS
ncbi:TIGR00725 family protein [Thermococcus nautili]|uniref:Putative Rossmann fold nucleotide-binding protein n=1 Tax=Thermococcus nautili TaxID=195522 RepID=W8PMT4_9EURY|nr:TIGR00725 family protein [Thermococcus nautili]AHL23349.1 putative Rossmann fold nucleotide-binding protein [Thermococcus nautili]CAI1493020.1 Putative Rossmann fold nucleotide-binding protein [Thermococcus nautili]